MKKITTIFLLAGLVTFYACGPNKTEIAKQEKIKLDSIHKADSVATTMKKVQFMQDSISHAAEIAKEKARLDAADNAETQHHKKGVMSNTKKH